jgi:uncharacterized protein YggE
VTVVGLGTVSGTPDTATMSFGVEAHAGSAAGAFGAEASAAQRLIDALSGAGVAHKDLQTQGLSLYQDPQQGGYTASSSVTATLRDLAKAPAQIDAGVAATGNLARLQGVSLYISDTSSLMSSARQAAVKDAAARAADYAKSAGLRVAGVVSMSEQSDTSPIRYQPMAGAAAASLAPQPIEAGQQDLTVTVTVVYALAQ